MAPKGIVTDCCKILELIGYNEKYTPVTTATGVCDTGTEFCYDATTLFMWPAYKPAPEAEKLKGHALASAYIFVATLVPMIWLFIFSIPLRLFGRRLAHVAGGHGAGLALVKHPRRK